MPTSGGRVVEGDGGPGRAACCCARREDEGGERDGAGRAACCARREGGASEARRSTRAMGAGPVDLTPHAQNICVCVPGPRPVRVQGRRAQRERSEWGSGEERRICVQRRRRGLQSRIAPSLSSLAHPPASGDAPSSPSLSLPADGAPGRTDVRLSQAQGVSIPAPCWRTRPPAGARAPSARSSAQQPPLPPAAARPPPAPLARRPTTRPAPPASLPRCPGALRP